MRAIVYRRYGPPEVLELEERDPPAPRENEILVRVRAAEATKADCEMRSFRFPVRWFWLPMRLAFGVLRPRRQILGCYFSGEIVSLGSGVSTSLKPGDRIFGSAGLRLGAYGQYVCIPAAGAIAIMPGSASFEEAAAVPLGGWNALHFMRRARIGAGERVLINGAGGSIGLFAVQIARAMGAEVTAVDSGIKADMLRRIGADHFVDYTKERFTDRGQRYDVIFDMTAKKSYGSCVRMLNPGGRYLMGNPRLGDMLRAGITSRLSDRQVVFAFARESTGELNDLAAMIDGGEIRPVVDRVYPMDQAAEAHHRVETEQRLGSVVISLE